MVKRLLLFAVVYLSTQLAVCVPGAIAQHEGHGGAPASEPPRGGREASNCQEVARRAVELSQQAEELAAGVEEPELRRRLEEHKLKLQELRAATETCAQHCARPAKRKGCGHMHRH